MSERMVIGVLGGTGKEGGGLAVRWAARGHDVIIGSRSIDKAHAAAQSLNELLAGRGSVRGGSLREVLRVDRGHGTAHPVSDAGRSRDR